MPTKTQPELRHRGSLITTTDPDDGRERCLGYLMAFEGKGVYEPSLGRVEVTSGDADIHNACLSRAEIEGLDKNCEVGMYGMFYANREARTVKTFSGDLVSAKVQINGSVLTFERNGMTFRGRLGKDCLFRFKRIA